MTELRAEIDRRLEQCKKDESEDVEEYRQRAREDEKLRLLDQQRGIELREIQAKVTEGLVAGQTRFFEEQEAMERERKKLLDHDAEIAERNRVRAEEGHAQYLRTLKAQEEGATTERRYYEAKLKGAE